MPTSAVSDNHRHIFQETELRLGQPGCADGEAVRSCGGGKRGFSETIVDLKLNLSSRNFGNKDDDLEEMKPNAGASSASAKPPSKAQFVGWPPVKSFRKNSVAVQKYGSDKGKMGSSGEAAFVKVSMDGAPYLRKVDLRIYKSYDELSDALAKMFRSFSIGKCGSENGLKDFMIEMNGSEYSVVTYEDKDGDWMLVGDLPWEMFVHTCKCLRIMKGSEAIGLAPRSMH